LVEAVSYRQRGHSVIDPAHYRSKDDLARAEAHDPVVAFADRLTAAGILDEHRLEHLTTEVLDEVERAVEFADKSEFPSVLSLFDTVYATPVHNAPSAMPGDLVA
jgi:pyruvate dehydrogenase E1 component alpha subunit